MIAGWTLWLLGCSPGDPFPAPDAFEPPEGPGVPPVSFAEADLFEPCAWLLGDARDREHHNLVTVRDGWLWHPWAPEDAGGGVSIYDLSDPCAPSKIGEGWSETMRESHTLAFGEADGREYLAVGFQIPEGEDRSAHRGGVALWDVTDRANPVWASELELSDFSYPDAYFYVVLSTFWQGPWLYVSYGLNGLSVIDASDPTALREVNRIQTDPPTVFGSFHVIGNLAMASSAGVARTTLFDVSDPVNPVPIPGGEFELEDRDGQRRFYYFSNIGGRYALFARNGGAGGPVVYDIADPAAPIWVADHPLPEGSGGYVFRHEDTLFQGESELGAVYDFSDPAAPTLLQRIEQRGDLDTITPLGHLMTVSVDDRPNPGQATSVRPWRAAPDTRGPRVELSSPAPDALQVALSGRIGLSFDEQVEAASVFAGSVRVADARGQPVPGRFNVQESLINFTPDQPWEPDTTYSVTLPAGGVTDISGNPTEVEHRFRFATGAELARERR
jgi:hypothetical protein